MLQNQYFYYINIFLLCLYLINVHLRPIIFLFYYLKSLIIVNENIVMSNDIICTKLFFIQQKILLIKTDYCLWEQQCFFIKRKYFYVIILSSFIYLLSTAKCIWHGL